MSEEPTREGPPGAKEERAPSGHPWQQTPLANFPPPEQWDDWVEYDAKAWPRKVEKRYRLVPTICFNCEAACGLVAYVDRDNGEVRKVEGNPYHPGSRGRNCAKGPATINQVHDPERILYPLKRTGRRGEGRFERTTWDEVIRTLAARVRKAIVEERRNEIMYHVGRPGHDGYMDRVLQAWGVDGHNSHTNVCSASARLGYALWSGADRPSPDHARAKFILLLSSHLETGHYFNPHAQRIIEGKMNGAKIATVDVRLSNTASMSDWWLATQPGTEAALLLAFAHVILREGLEDRDFLREWVNWESWMEARHPGEPREFARFVELLREEHLAHTPEWAAAECGVEAETIEEIGRAIGEARGGFASHVWRNACAGNRGGWQVARCLQFLCVLTGSVGTPGGTHLNSDNKFVAAPFAKPPPQKAWNELLYPPEWPLAHHELSFLLPHFLLEGRGKVDTYFTRVFNPVWTFPDGFTWAQALSDEDKIGCHVALTPTMSETALYADYVLPMGHATERHDVMSQETHAGRWIGFRQPVQRVARERAGEKIAWTWETNPGEVWEEDEFWIALSWAVDEDGSLGIRQWFESPYRPGERITVEEYYRWMFEHSVPGLPEAAAGEGLSPLEYMRRHGCFEVAREALGSYREEVGAGEDGVEAGGARRRGFRTPSKKLELHSPTMEEWGYGEHAGPGYLRSHVHESELDREAGEFALVPTFRLPTLIHSRSANAKWLNELSNTNPVWIHVSDARRIGVEDGDLLRVSTGIGYFVNRARVTEGVRPGVVACSHHLGRWRTQGGGAERWGAAPVRVEEAEPGVWRIRRVADVGPWDSADPDSKRVWWIDGGVHQNLTFPVQPDPISGMHCWHQKVRVEPAHLGDRYGDVQVDTNKSMEVYRRWLGEAESLATRPAEIGLRRPLHFARAVKPDPGAYRIPAGGSAPPAGRAGSPPAGDSPRDEDLS